MTTLEAPASPPVTETHRVSSIDIVRGIVMVLMAIDHVRVYGYRWSLPLLYFVTAIVVTVLYIPCRWFARLKKQRKDLKWLSYL